MGLLPTRGNENQRRPRESEDPLSLPWIPACAGMTRLSGELPWAFGPPERMKILSPCARRGTPWRALQPPGGMIFGGARRRISTIFYFCSFSNFNAAELRQ